MTIRKRLWGMVTAILAVTFFATGCAASTEKPTTDALNVFATTGYLADAVANIAPDARVVTMVGPGGDPHTYQPSTKDIEAMRDADLVLWNGLHLEAQMIDQLESYGDKQLAVGEQLPDELLLPWPETDDHGNTPHDPHVWNSPEAWSLVVGSIADKLAELDPNNAATYRDNAAKYQEEIANVAEDAKHKLEHITGPRVLITGHDAFNYLGKTYDLEVHATDFVSTEAALSPEQLSELADLIADRKVPAIFQDNQVNPQAITSLKEAVHARGWEVRVSTEELFADSLGSEPSLDSYLEVFAHNADVIAEALGGTH